MGFVTCVAALGTGMVLRAEVALAPVTAGLLTVGELLLSAVVLTVRAATLALELNVPDDEWDEQPVIMVASTRAAKGTVVVRERPWRGAAFLIMAAIVQRHFDVVLKVPPTFLASARGVRFCDEVV